MAAVRPKLAVLPSSGAEYAWSMKDSPASDFLDLVSAPPSPAVVPVSTTSKGKAASVPQPSVKKMRRRVALLSGVHLNLPKSPVVGPSPPGSSRELAWTFTAEWDSAHDEIVFSDLESSGSSSSGSSLSSVSASARFFPSLIPFDVSEDELGEMDVLTPPPTLSISPYFADMSSTSSSSSSSASCSPSSPAVSDIFDLYTSTPSTGSFNTDESSSTAPSSPVDAPSPTHLSPSSYPDSRFDPPVISVTFVEEDECESVLRTSPLGRVPVDSDRGVAVRPMSAIQASSWKPILDEKPHVVVHAPLSAGIPQPRRRRPLPPVPVRPASQA